MINYQKDLNSEQYKIVTEGDGHCLVLAGAGSGKTRTLIYRVAYLLEQGIDPCHILLMTFTNKAADEMILRVKLLLGYEPKGLWAGTFHRIGNIILRKYGYLLGFTPSFTILDTSDSKDLLKLIIRELQIDTKQQQFPKIDVILTLISKARNSQCVFIEYLETYYAFPAHINTLLVSIAHAYQKRKKTLNSMDFDDLLVLTLELLKGNSQVQAKLSSQFKYILIDEYQDTNLVQAELIARLGKEHKNILAVGDDAQSIYSFRAANIKNILDFPKNFSQTKIYKIQTNYRSSPEILHLANESIKNNVNQFAKDLKSVREPGQKPILKSARDVYEQAELIVKRIQDIQTQGKTLKDIAVLFRAGHHSAELQLSLSKHNIPFIVRSGQRFFDSAHIKDIIAFLKVWQNITDELSWLRILKMLPHVGQMTAQKLVRQFNSCENISKLLHTDFNLTPKQQQSFEDFRNIFTYLDDIAAGEEKKIADGIHFVLSQFYKTYVKSVYEDYESRLDDITAFVNFTSTYTSLDELLTDVTLSEDYKQQTNKQDQDMVVLSTIHQAKGLEWPEVIVIGLHKGSFPHFKSFENQAELEEERRLFYVAVTRAKEQLTFLYPQMTHSYEFGQMYSEPSLFIEELPPNSYLDMTYFEEEDLGGSELLTRNVRWKQGDDFFEEDVIEYD